MTLHATRNDDKLVSEVKACGIKEWRLHITSELFCLLLNNSNTTFASLNLENKAKLISSPTFSQSETGQIGFKTF